MIVDCISDLHGFYPKLDGGDLLIVAGDLTARDREAQYFNLFQKLSYENYKKIIIIAGNHDNCLQIDDRTISWAIDNHEIFEYLCDSSIEFEGLKIWGSPWSLRFYGINPKCAAFTGSEAEISNHFDKISEDTDILITHSPPHGILDECADGRRVGCLWLNHIVLGSSRVPKLKLHVFGHIHECGGKIWDTTHTKFVNSSHVDERYRPVNQPVRVIL